LTKLRTLPPIKDDPRWFDPAYNTFMPGGRGWRLRHYERKIYEWADGSDAVVRLENFQGAVGDADLVVRWRGLGVDPVNGQNYDPIFAFDPFENRDEPGEMRDRQILANHYAQSFPTALRKKLLGLFLDLGVGRPCSSPDLVSTQVGNEPTVPCPRFIPDDLWARRYEEARLVISDFEKLQEPYLGEVRCLHIANHVGLGYVQPWRAIWNFERLAVSHGQPLRARWYFKRSAMSDSFEGVVDRVLDREMILPESERTGWEAAHVERGTLLLPTREEVELFRLLGEPLPFWWPQVKLAEWLRERPRSEP